AKSLWDGKSSAQFDKIRTILKQMCVGIEICVYCEMNEATDIEHIYPKKLFPEKAFSWENYSLACGKCNSDHKKDKFKIFNPQNSVTVEDITLPPKTYKQPDNDDALFINQRKFDPMDFLELDIINWTLFFDEKFPEGTREYEMAKFTKDLLGLNTRGGLPEARKAEFIFFRDRLEKYVSAKKSTTFHELKKAVVDNINSIDETKPFSHEKTRMLESIKTDVLKSAHPTVWKELIRQRAKLPRTDELLNHAPEVLAW
nr:HNH endonuclease [Pyrinomonadaceae bacterium]